jgi:hypothetical protein
MSPDGGESGPVEGGGTATRTFRLAGREYASAEALFDGFAESGHALNERGLVGLGAEVATDSPSHVAVDVLNSAFRDSLLTDYGEATGNTRLAEIDARWHEEFEAWRELVARAKPAGGPDVFPMWALRARGRILQALLDPEANDELREEAARAYADERPRRWLGEGIDPKQALPGTLMALAVMDAASATFVDHEADRQTAASRKRRNRWITLAVVGVVLVGGAFLLFGGGDESDAPGPAATGSGTGDGTPTAAPTQILSTAVTLGETTVRGEADATAAEVGVFPINTVMRVISDSTPEWYQVNVEDETGSTVATGWVERESVRIACQGSCSIG